ncbi:MAG: HAD-IIIC family phosphatase [Oscillospiraceae bacterium]|jgi:FkbH-like protein|nr:HAD-IIIC family phosphatase [Oscillospiraceae bacterium]
MPDILTMPPGEVLRKKRALLRELSAGGVFTPVRIALLSSSTVGELENILRLYLLAHGVEPVFFAGQYDRWYEEAAFGDAALTGFQPDIVYIHTSFRNLGDPDEMFSKLETAWAALGCAIVQNNFEMPPFRVMGNRDASHGLLSRVEELNRSIVLHAASHSRFYVNDIHWLSAWFGLERWFDDALWYTAKYAMSLEALVLLCRNLANIVKSLLGKNKKALALDLDNTLWGGIVGDDGADALEQTADTPNGMAFLDFQKYLKQVSALGIPLNIVSKNSEDAALAGLSRAYLKREDIVCFYANWDGKDKSLRAVARDLNIGADSIVFVDDNPAERELVRQSLPDTAVPEITSPETMIRTLDAAGYFEITALTEDDRARVAAYQAEQERKKEERSFSDYSEYLRSLRMTASFEPVSAGNAARVTQLINKTNQFNLTARRCPESEIAALPDDPGTVALCGRLADRFGDHGLVTVLIASLQGETAEIDVWVMSCRVFKRGLEYAALRRLLELLRERGVKTVRGVYLPTGKNQPVETLYRDLGFSGGDGGVWTAAINDIMIPETFMGVGG